MILINKTAKELISIDRSPDTVKAWLSLNGRWKKTDKIIKVPKSKELIDEIKYYNIISL